MTNNNIKKRVRAYMAEHGVNYTTALRAVSTREPATAVALVRETWPITGPDGVWDGDLLQLAVDCPLCGRQHRHGGRVSEGRDLGGRIPHCPTPYRSADHYVILDKRPRQTVSDSFDSDFRFSGTWPGDPEPTVDAVMALTDSEAWDEAIAFVRDNLDLPPVTLRAAWGDGLGWNGTDESDAAGSVAIIEHPATPDDVAAQVVHEALEFNRIHVILALAASTAMRDVDRARRLVIRDCGGDHDVLRTLAANLDVTADTLGWISEHATGFLHDVDEELGRLILDNPNLDDEVLGFFVDRVEQCAEMLLESPRLDAWAGSSILDHAAAVSDPGLAVRAAERLADIGGVSLESLRVWLKYGDEHGSDEESAIREAVRSVLARAAD